MLFWTKNQIFRKTKGFLISCLVFLFVAIFCIPQVNADDLDQKQKELDGIQKEISKYQQQIDAKQNKINSLNSQIGLMDNQIAKLNLEIKATTLEIEQNTEKIKEVTKKIAIKQKEIKYQTEVVGRLILSMYQREQKGVLEIILDSEDFSDFLDQLTYLELVEKQGQEALNYLNELKKQLDEEKIVLVKAKKTLNELQDKQVTQKQSLVTQKNTKNRLLARTQGEEASYQAMLQGSYRQASVVQSQIAEIIARRTGSTPGGGYGTGGYPWNGQHGVDPWGFYMGQCTSYAAWKWSTLGRTVTWRGNARDWASRAAAQGYRVDQVPKSGTIICWVDLSSWGHVGIVNSVSGSQVTFTDYNGWGGSEKFGWGTINYRSGQWGRIYFIH